jgi:predicted aminopeptidase
VRLALLPHLLTLAACSPLYVLRAGYEEARILWRREPITRLLADPELGKATRAQLELVLAVRAFARDDLGLRVGGSYSSYARVDPDQMVSVVAAAPRLQLVPYTWWFPIVGRVPYKGFFSAAAAEQEAESLERRGFDTLVRRAVAFSTLGWFDDPLLSNQIALDRVALAEVIFHELLHNTIYLAGHAEFDESFATFVGHQGAIAFFVAAHDLDGARQAVAAWQDALAFSEFLGRFAARLRAAYAGGADLARRAALFADGQAEFRRAGLEAGRYRRFGSEPLNNAIVLQYLAYTDRLALFAQLQQDEGGDLRHTIGRVRALVRAHADDPFAAVDAAVRSARTAVRADAVRSGEGVRVDGYNSSVPRRRIAERTATTNTAPVSARAATSDAPMPATVRPPGGTPCRRPMKMTYTGHASSTTIAPMNDMHRTM